MMQKTNEPLEIRLERWKQQYLSDAPWAVRITERKDRPAPYMEMKTRRWVEEKKSKTSAKVLESGDEKQKLNSVLKECGCMYGPKLTRCLPIVKDLLSKVRTPDDNVSMQLDEVISKNHLTVSQKTLPLDEEAGVKLALLFKIAEGIKDLDRVEVAALRIHRFTREEAMYWYSRATAFGKALNSWSLTGMRMMLAGGPKVKKADIASVLEELRNE